jgi:hypothetical protein
MRGGGFVKTPVCEDGTTVLPLVGNPFKKEDKIVSSKYK